MTSDHLRRTFLQYFERRQHIVVPSSALTPDDDPSVLLTTAGMQQFKPYFLGRRDPVKDFGSKRLVSVQRCFRTTDIDAVGDDTHNTFFEMLGNFSVGDYFKAEAIAFAWDFLTKELHIVPECLWATIFKGDDLTPKDAEAETLWRRCLPAERIVAFGREDNFWGPPGSTGPCGPCSELHVDRTGKPCTRGSDCRPNCPCGRFMEVWNLVFTELEKTDRGTFQPLGQKNIDTGMGLERLALVVQRCDNIFATDLFRGIIDSVAQQDALGSLEIPERERRKRILADHLRAAVFLLADGITFSNKDQGYVLRRIVRRAVDQLTLPDTNLTPIIQAVIETYRQSAPFLKDRRSSILDALQAEQRLYAQVLRLDVEKVLGKIRHHSPMPTPQPSSRKLTAEEAFTLYTSYGLSPGRLIREGFTFNRQTFDQLVSDHQAKSREHSQKKFGGHGLDHALKTGDLTSEQAWQVTRLHSATHLLHSALRTVLGSEVRQNGSDINPERLRFDFTFPRKLTDQERQAVEDQINEKVQADLPVSWQTLPFKEALRQGALAFFKEKYGDTVRVYQMGDFSKELCGGPHVEHTSQIGKVSILSEKSVASGVRRIKAVVSTNP